nr:DUF4348 domain-containing protein [Prevotella sp.]
MNKFVIVVFLSVILTMSFTASGCSDKKPSSADSVAVNEADSDSMAHDSAESIIAETPMPKAADELFDDFIFNFAANRKLQRRRIAFPLKVYRNGKLEKEISRNNWKIEHFFMHQDYYTIIFDSKRQMNLVKDTTINHVIIEKVFFARKLVKQYSFNRINGQWKMTSINYKKLFKNKNASFLAFYESFVNDTAYQNHHINNPLKFTGPDPDDDFSTMSGDLLPEQWPAFASQAVLPKNMIYNIIYGQKYKETNRKIFVVRGIANGLEQEFSFRKIRGKWMLTKLDI